MIDSCCFVGSFWPGREQADGAPVAVRRSLTRAGVTRAAVSLLEGAWYREGAAANVKLLELIADHRDFFVPVGVVDPSARYWKDELERSVRAGIGALRIYPGYHHFYLDDVATIAVARHLGSINMPLFVTLMVEEDRFAHPAVKPLRLGRPSPASQNPERREYLTFDTGIKPRPIAALQRLIEAAPETTFIINGADPGQALAALSDRELCSGRVYFDICRMDKPTLGLDLLIGDVGEEQLVLGTSAPLLYPEGAITNLAFRDFSDSTIRKITSENIAENELLRGVLMGEPARR